MSNIEQLRADIGDDRWADDVTNDPAVWFEWVQAYWEALGASFDGLAQNGSNQLTFPDGRIRDLVIPYDGADPIVTPVVEGVEKGAERASLESFRALLAEWEGSLRDLRNALPTL